MGCIPNWASMMASRWKPNEQLATCRETTTRNSSIYPCDQECHGDDRDDDYDDDDDDNDGNVDRGHDADDDAGMMIKTTIMVKITMMTTIVMMTMSC